MNAVRNCGRLSADLLKRLSYALGVERRQASHAQATAARLLGVSVSLLKRTLQMVDVNGGQPVPAAEHDDVASDGVAQRQRPSWRH